MKRKLLLKTIVMLTQLPVYVYSSHGEEIEKYEIIPRNMSESEHTLIQKMKRRLKDEDFVAVEYGGILPVRMYGVRGANGYYRLGPFAYGSLDSGEIQAYMRREKIEDFPRVQIRSSLLAANLVLNVFSGKDTGKNLLEGCTEGDEDLRMYSLTGEELRQNDTFQSNHTQADENVMYQYIEQGDEEYLKENYDLLYLPHPVILDEVHKNEEYMAVIGISLASRAAIRGGLTSKEGFLVNDIYLKQLSLCKNVTEIYDLVKEAHIYCASQVRKKRRAGMRNQYVEKCKKLIISKKLEPVDLTGLAEEVGVSKDYLSRLFRRYEGVPVMEYVLNTRIEAACNMLRYSDRQINEIADYLNFGSLSYFSRIFKKKMGMSPQQYRKNIENPVN